MKAAPGTLADRVSAKPVPGEQAQVLEQVSPPARAGCGGTTIPLYEGEGGQHQILQGDGGELPDTSHLLPHLPPRCC